MDYARDMNTRCLLGHASPGVSEAEKNRSKLVYADLIGQSGEITKQLLEHPPAGYRFVTRKKFTTAFADFTHADASFRKMKRMIHRFLPTNLLINYGVTRFMKPPMAVDLTFSMSTVVFRPEPWVLYLEVPTQLAGFNHHNLRHFRKTLERGLGSAYCRAIICQSEAARRALRRQLHPQPFEHKLHVVHCGWLPKPAAKLDQRREGPVRILFVGGSTMSFGFSIKGGLECLEAFVALRQRYSGLELIVRSDVEPQIRRRFDGVPGLRIVNNLIPYQELEALYRQADIYWYPAHCLMSISVLEAMSYGLPVVTTDYYDNPEYIEDGRTGMIVPHHRHLPPWDTSELEVRKALRTLDPDFVRTLVEKTAVLIDNAELRRRMGLAARAEIEGKFSLAENNRKLKAIFDQATARS